MISLSNKQQEIVEADIGIAIQVLASAGTGKTRVLTERVRHLINNTKQDGIIALTFTNKAAEEMSNRLSDISDLKERCWIGTIHSIAQRVLENYGHTIGLPTDLHIFDQDQDRKAVFLQSLRNSGVNIDEYLGVPDDKEKRKREKIINDLLTKFSMVKRNLLSDAEVHEKYSQDEQFIKLYFDYREALLESGGIDFDDILLYVNRIFIEQSWCADIYRAKYKHLCIDEAQDLNHAQYEFIRSLCGDQISSVLMVGDPNQMIYGFTGASENYLCVRFPEEFHATKFRLVENYRSSKAIIRLANKLKSESQRESAFALEGYSEIIDSLNNEHEEASWIVGKIRHLLSTETHQEIEGTISLEKMVVIARNQYVFRTLEKELDDCKIPYLHKRGDRLIQPSTTIGKSLDCAIRLHLNPKDWVHGKELCDTLGVEKPSSWGGNDLLQQLSVAVRNSETPNQDILADLLNDVQSLNQEEPNFPKLIKSISDRLKSIATESIMTEEAGSELERALQELEFFQRLWINYRLKGLGNSLSAFRNAMALGQLLDEKISSGLTLSTVHTMKGLEKDIVFLMGMNEGTFPDYRSKTPREIDEETNNAFVAITRAKRWIYITYPKSKMMPWEEVKQQQASRFFVTLSS